MKRRFKVKMLHVHRQYLNFRLLIVMIQSTGLASKFMCARIGEYEAQIPTHKHTRKPLSQCNIQIRLSKKMALCKPQQLTQLIAITLTLITHTHTQSGQLITHNTFTQSLESPLSPSFSTENIQENWRKKNGEE